MKIYMTKPEFFRWSGYSRDYFYKNEILVISPDNEIDVEKTIVNIERRTREMPNNFKQIAERKLKAVKAKYAELSGLASQNKKIYLPSSWVTERLDLSTRDDIVPLFDKHGIQHNGKHFDAEWLDEIIEEHNLSRFAHKWAKSFIRGDFAPQPL